MVSLVVLGCTISIATLFFFRYGFHGWLTFSSIYACIILAKLVFLAMFSGKLNLESMMIPWSFSHSTFLKVDMISNVYFLSIVFVLPSLGKRWFLID